MKGWHQPVSHVFEFEALPGAMKDYIRFIEDRVELKINIISLGPGRENTLMR